jgi:hypothetical protein
VRKLVRGVWNQHTRDAPCKIILIRFGTSAGSEVVCQAESLGSVSLGKGQCGGGFDIRRMEALRRGEIELE